MHQALLFFYILIYLFTFPAHVLPVLRRAAEDTVGSLPALVSRRRSTGDLIERRTDGRHGITRARVDWSSRHLIKQLTIGEAAGRSIDAIIDETCRQLSDAAACLDAAAGFIAAVDDVLIFAVRRDDGFCWRRRRQHPPPPPPCVLEPSQT